MKAKLLIVLPVILSVGILLGYLVQVLAFSSTALNPGHPASEIGGTADSDRIFSNAMYTFPDDLVVSGSVGIGTTNPASKLVVTGTVNIADKAGMDVGSPSLIIGDSGDTSAAGGQFNIADTMWLSQQYHRMYVLNGIRTDGDIIVQTGNLNVQTGDLNVGGNIKGIKFATKIAEVWNKKLSLNYPSGGPLFTVTPDEGHTTLILERTSWDINNADSKYDKYWARITFTDGTTRDEDIKSGSTDPVAQTHDDILIHGADYYKLWGNNKAVAKWEVWGIVIGSNTILSVEFHGWQV